MTRELEGGYRWHLHGENCCTATNIENDLVLKKVLVLNYRIHV